MALNVITPSRFSSLALRLQREREKFPIPLQMCPVLCLSGGTIHHLCLDAPSFQYCPSLDEMASFLNVLKPVWLDPLIGT